MPGRRLSLHNFNKKPRDRKRELAHLKKWADSFKDYFPGKLNNRDYLNFKIPVSERLVQGPYTKDKIRKFSIECIVSALVGLSRSVEPNDESVIVAAVVSFPQLFSSEVTIFDKEYFNTFPARGNWTRLPSTKNDAFGRLKIRLSDDMSYVRYREIIHDEDSKECKYEGEVYLVQRNRKK